MAHSPHNPEAPVAPTPKLPRLLVVDDQPINIQTLFHIFSQDHEVFMATSGPQALQACASNPPDLVLLDVVMPDMDGLEVCRRLKADAATRDIPVIFVTSLHDVAEETAGLTAGAVDFITKPVNAAVVRARVHAHLALYQLKVHLETMVAQRTAELQAALHSLRESQDQLAGSEARATLSTLIASVSHELGTPIGNGMLMASTMAEQAKAFAQAAASGTLKRSDLSTFVENMQEGTTLLQGNLRRATSLLTDFRQVAADQASEQQREFDLATMVGEVLSTLSPTLKRHSHRVEVNIPPGLTMHSQPGSLGQVFINLINNAYLHALEGRDNGVLTIEAQARGDNVHIRVEDNGVGIPEEHLSQLTKAFFSTKIGQGGTGLGMAIVENLVCKTLRGRLDVASTVGKGTRFDITLPKVLPSSAAST